MYPPRLRGELRGKSHAFSRRSQQREGMDARIADKNGADERTRTSTDCSTTPSKWRVYQFHHIRKSTQPDRTGTRYYCLGAGFSAGFSGSTAGGAVSDALEGFAGAEFTGAAGVSFAGCGAVTGALSNTLVGTVAAGRPPRYASVRLVTKNNAARTAVTCERKEPEPREP